MVPALNGCEDAFWVGGPDEWVGIGIGIGDEAVDGELQVDDGMDHLPYRDLRFDRIKEADELLVAMTLRCGL